MKLNNIETDLERTLDAPSKPRTLSWCPTILMMRLLLQPFPQGFLIARLKSLRLGATHAKVLVLPGGTGFVRPTRFARLIRADPSVDSLLKNHTGLLILGSATTKADPEQLAQLVHASARELRALPV